MVPLNGFPSSCPEANADFIPNFSSNTYHMRKLLKNNFPFLWRQDQDKEFECLKTMLCYYISIQIHHIC